MKVTKIHHLNCISTCPLGGRLFDARTPSVFERGCLTCHCLLLETEGSRLVLVDTGLGLEDVKDPQSRLSNLFLVLVSPDFREDLTAIRQIESLGLDPRNVSDIVLSHCDFDHCGGLDDFPWATVHMMASERESAEAQISWLDRQRYRPQQWNHRERWKTYKAEGNSQWFGFNAIQVPDLGEDILMIPLIGHTLGHCGIAVRDRIDQQWKLLAGDAYFFHREMEHRDPYCTPGLRFYQRMMEKDRESRWKNQDRLRELAKNNVNEVRVFCSHDLTEFERLTSGEGSAGVPIHLREEEKSPAET